MRVIVNGLAALKPKTGVGHHVAQLAAALSAGFPADTFTLYPGAASRLLASRPPGTPSAAKGKGGRLKPAAAALAKRLAGVHFAAYTSAFRFDLYHEPNFVPFRSRLPTVVTVHDLSVVRHPEWHPAERVRLHGRHFFAGLRRARRVVTVSEAVRQELLAESGLDPARVVAVPNGIDKRYRPWPADRVAAARARLGLPERFFLAVGTVEPRKNLLMLMRAFAALPAGVRRGCPLVIAGPWGWKSDPERDFLTLHGDASVRHLGYVADSDLVALFNAATALVYPSHYEGFGLPPVEMLACGGRVLASTAAALREVCGPFAAFLDPADPDAWRAALQAVAEGGDTPGTPESRQAHAARYSWAHAARLTRGVYAEVLV